MTDFLNAFEALYMSGVLDARRPGDRGVMGDVQLVLLDEAIKGPFDEAWKTIFSPNHALMRPSLYRKASSARILYPRAVFVHPGYSNMMFANLLQDGAHALV